VFVMVTGFGADVDLQDVLAAASVELDPKGLYLAKQYRNCQSMAAVFGAFNLALKAKDREIARLNREIANLADRHSREAAKTASLAEENSRIRTTAIRRGLEATDLSPATQERLLTVNGK
jgi:hypothetical protein